MADRSERLRHLFPDADATSRRSFIAPRSPRDPNRQPAFPARADPAAHAGALIRDLRSVSQGFATLNDDRRAEQVEDCKGAFIDIQFVPNEDFPLKSLSDERSGIEVVTVTELGPQLAQATVFVPEGELKVLERKIQAFARNGRNPALVSSLESIRRAVARSFWTDSASPFPSGSGDIWWEVWLRRGIDASRFRRHAKIMGLHVSGRELRFPDRTVLLVRGTVAAVTRSAELLDSVAELRSAPPLDLEFIHLDAVDENDFALDMAKRTKRAPSDAPAVCLLDTGVDFAHPLLQSGIEPKDVHTCFGTDLRDRFGDGDWHGTGAAGLALFGNDLARIILASDEFRHSHHLESVKYIPSAGKNDPDLHGEITKEAVARVEGVAPERRRIIVTTVTADKTTKGEPTSWSAAVDQLCSGVDDEDRLRRLIVLSAGNVLPHTGYTYPDTNHVETIEDPAQAWNALTVGAYTERTDIEEAGYQHYEPMAPAGDISPSSRTSLAWVGANKMSPPPFKPDCVCEGGNWASEPGGTYPAVLDSLTPLSTCRRDRTGTRLLSRFGATSGAAATAACFAARLQGQYPDLWPETIRALLVHSCRYSPAMEEAFRGVTRRRRAENLLRCFGWGVPDFERASFSARNEATLVIEREIQPFRIDPQDKKGKTNEMHLHRLPWPAEVLEDLGELDVRLRVTLSYFVEPNPGKRGVTGDARTVIVDAARYPSFGLRFDVTTAGESPAQLLARVNAADGTGRGSSDFDEWDLGQSRTRGSIHSDVWRGSAADLADKSAVAVVPVNGWWRFRHKSHEICERTTRYALVVSIESDAESIDVYTPIMNQIAIER